MKWHDFSISGIVECVMLSADKERRIAELSPETAPPPFLPGT